MIRKQTLVILVSATSLVAVAGCQSKQKPTARQQQLEPSIVNDTGQRMTELQRRSGDLATIASQLPGRDVKEDRELIAQAFDATSDSLTMMGGPEPGGALRQQLRIIENIRQFLRSSDPKLSHDPAVDAGLRATHSALDGIRERLFPTDETVRSQVNALGERIGELDHVRGPMHSVVVAQVFQTASSAIDTMGGILNARAQRLTEAAPPPAPARALPAAAPAAASTPPPAPTAPPAAPLAPARVAAPAPSLPPAPPVAPAPPPAPAAAPAATAQQPTAEEYQQLQRKNEELQRQLQQLQQQPTGQPAAAPVAPAPAAPAPPPAVPAPAPSDANNK